MNRPGICPVAPIVLVPTIDTLCPKLASARTPSMKMMGSFFPARLLNPRMRIGLDIPENPFVKTFQEAFSIVTPGQSIACGAKPFCDDCNTFWALADIPGITHGPNAGGAHTLEEWVSIDDLVRVAHLYALTAVSFCAA